MIAEIEAARGAARTDGTVEIWPENWDIVNAFCAVSTQWRMTGAGMGGLYYIGLDYAAARAGIELAGFELSPPFWEGIRIMEREALSCLNARD